MSATRDSNPARRKKQRRSRSRGYPAIDLRAAKPLLKTLETALGVREFTRDEAAKKLGYSSGSSGLVARKLAALVHYGLLDKPTCRLRVSDLGHRFLGANLREVRQARKDAFLHPALFQEIEETYREDGRIPRYLSQALVEKFRISERARNEVAKIFRESARFSEVLNEDGEFIVSETSRVPSSERQAPSPVEQSVAQVSAVAMGSRDLMSISIPLGPGREAKLELPRDFAHHDIDALRAYMKYLEFLVTRAAEETSVLPFKPRS